MMMMIMIVQSLQCSWTSSLELSADGPQTAGYNTAVSDSRWRCFHFVRGPKCSV